jgi:hypothetical protein
MLFRQPSTINQWDEPRSFGTRFSKAKWEYQWKGIIHRHLARLRPKPTHIVFNEGLWRGSGLSNETFAEIRKALRAHGMRGIYKTTTKRSENQSPGLDDFDAVGCSLFNPCLDLSWTYVLAGWPFYWDKGTHFTSHVYTLFNQQLFRLLHDLSLNSGQ